MTQVAMLLFVCDPMAKIFADTPVPASRIAEIAFRCARNEYESAQFAIRSATALPATTVDFGPLKHADGYEIGGDEVRWSFVGTIPLRHNTPCANRAALVREAPCDMPDPLLAERARDIPAGVTQPVWLTVRVPKDAPAGAYRGEVVVSSGRERSSVPVVLNVWPFTLPDERHLKVTNWVNFSRIAEAHGTKAWSDEFWPVYGRYLDNMREHRQNIAWVPWNLIKAFREGDGTLTFDYTQFDRCVELLHEHGVADMLEIQFVGGFKDGWGGREIALRGLSAVDRESGASVKLDFTNGTALLLADLEKHLADRGWLDKAAIHVADESSQHNLLSWQEKSRLVHQAAPRLRRIDAIEASDFGDDLEVLVPKLSHLRNWYAHYKQAQAEGKELWYYICCHPTGGYYPNRFLDYQLPMVRMLHWLNYAYGIEGFLHWGWCAWPAEDPFDAPSERLPPGDCNTVYPGPDGPLDSLRWEAQRDSLEDFEYLWLLTQRMAGVKEKLGAAASEFDPAERSLDFCRRLVRDFADVESDPGVIRAVRDELAEEIVAADQEPLVLLSTRPQEGSLLVPGPIMVEIHGAVRPGTSVTGAKVYVEPDGRFRGLVSVSAKAPWIALTVSRDDKEKALTRTFRVLP